MLKGHRDAPLAGANQGDTLFGTIAGHLAAMRGFARVYSGALMHHQNSQMDTSHPSPTSSPEGRSVGEQQSQLLPIPMELMVAPVPAQYKAEPGVQ